MIKALALTTLSLQLLALPAATNVFAQTGPADCGHTSTPALAPLDHVRLTGLGIEGKFPVKVIVNNGSLDFSPCESGPDGAITCDQSVANLAKDRLVSGREQSASWSQQALFGLGILAAAPLAFVAVNGLWGTPLLAVCTFLTFVDEGLLAGLAMTAGTAALGTLTGLSAWGTEMLATNDIATNQFSRLGALADEAQQRREHIFYMSFASAADRDAMLEAARTGNPFTRRK